MQDDTRGKPGLVSIVVPTYREVENLRLLVPRVAEALGGIPFEYEMVIVDDSSQDGTEECIATYRDQGFPVKLITRKGKRGLSSAVVRGFREARGSILVCMDADFSHPPEKIRELAMAFEDPSVDFALGSRYVPTASTDADWGMFRSLNSRIATLLARPLHDARDPMSGFFAIRRDVFDRADPLNPVGYKIGLELLVKCRCSRVEEIPIHFANRKLGQSKLNLKEQLNYLKHLKRLYDYKFGSVAQFAEFCLVGATGVVVDLAAYAVIIRLGVVLLAARAIAILIAMTWNFWLNRRLAFSYSRAAHPLPQYLRFVASCGVGALISWSLSIFLATSVPLFHGHELLAAGVGIAVGTVTNFLLSRVWVFRRLRRSGTQDNQARDSWTQETSKPGPVAPSSSTGKHG